MNPFKIDTPRLCLGVSRCVRDRCSRDAAGLFPHHGPRVNLGTLLFALEAWCVSAGCRGVSLCTGFTCICHRLMIRCRILSLSVCRCGFQHSQSVVLGGSWIVLANLGLRLPLLSPHRSGSSLSLNVLARSCWSFRMCLLRSLYLSPKSSRSITVTQPLDLGTFLNCLSLCPYLLKSLTCGLIPLTFGYLFAFENVVLYFLSLFFFSLFLVDLSPIDLSLFVSLQSEPFHALHS